MNPKLASILLHLIPLLVIFSQLPNAIYTRHHLSHRQFEVNFARSPYKEFFKVAPYAGYLFRLNQTSKNSNDDFIAMPQCQTALIEQGEALINKVCSRIIFENHWEDDLAIAYRCFTRNESEIEQYPFIYMLQVRPIRDIKYEVNGSAAFVYYKPAPMKGECSVVLAKEHMMGVQVHQSYSGAKKVLTSEYCKNCREDLKPKSRRISFSEVQYEVESSADETFKDEIDRDRFDVLFASILDPYLRLTSFVAVYQLNEDNHLVPHCLAFLLNKGIAFVNIFECSMKNKAENYVVIHRCFYGTEQKNFFLKRSKVDSVVRREDGAEVYFQQNWSASCRPTWETSEGNLEVTLSPKGEL